MSEAGIRRRWRARLKAAQRQLAAAMQAVKAATEATGRARRVLARHRPKKKTRLLWHPDATRVPGRDAGPFVKAGAKLLWHTTEGSSAEGAINAYGATGSWPHFTFEPKTGRLFQHLPLNVAGRALEHPAGTVETNRANVIQVELVGRAAETPKWTDAEYARVAMLARWIEYNARVPRRCTVVFNATPQRQAQRLSGADWLAYAGHIGHCHAPSNHHWDPGSLRIDRVLA